MTVSVLLVEYLIVAVLFLFFLFVWHATRVSISHLVRFPFLVLLDHVFVLLLGSYSMLPNRVYYYHIKSYTTSYNITKTKTCA